MKKILLILSILFIGSDIIGCWPRCCPRLKKTKLQRQTKLQVYFKERNLAKNFYISPTDTVPDLKRMIAQEWQIPTKKQVLIIDDQLAVDTLLLNKYLYATLTIKKERPLFRSWSPRRVHLEL